MLAQHDRYRFAPIHGRPDWCWPEGKRLAVYLGLNLEHFAFGQGLGAKLVPGGHEPDIANYSWRDYGNRVGAWRLLELFDSLGLPTSVLVNSTMYDEAPGLVAAHRARGDEIVAHGRTNAERQSVLDEPDERALILEATARIAAEEGRAPRGWLGPWIAESRATPDLLQEAGYAYLLDWCMDDQPVWMRTRQGRILSVPYPQELNDIPVIVARQRGAREFADMIIDQLDEMLSQSRRQPLVMGVALHAYLVGQPYRLKELDRALRHITAHREEIWIATAGAIAEYAEALEPGTLV